MLAKTLQFDIPTSCKKECGVERRFCGAFLATDLDKSILNDDVPQFHDTLTTHLREVIHINKICARGK
jgi:hypothetical protein